MRYLLVASAVAACAADQGDGRVPRADDRSQWLVRRFEQYTQDSCESHGCVPLDTTSNCVSAFFHVFRQNSQLVFENTQGTQEVRLTGCARTIELNSEEDIARAIDKLDDTKFKSTRTSEDVYIRVKRDPDGPAAAGGGDAAKRSRSPERRSRSRSKSRSKSPARKSRSPARSRSRSPPARKSRSRSRSPARD